MPRKIPTHPVHRRSSFGIRLATFLTVALVVIGVSIWLLRPQSGASLEADHTLEITMGGFTPPALTVPAGTAVSLKLINPDTPFHMDGGGVHQFAIPDLGVDVLIQPETTQVITLPAAKAGTYAFYCDVCCGGKENPAMQGTITVG